VGDLIRKFRAESIPAPREYSAFELPELPLEIEVGCGVGMHPIRYARANPNRYLVAIEHTRTRFSRFEGRLKHHPPIPNLKAIHANAISWITHRVPARSVERYFFLYPNPDQRWHSMPFMEKVIETMKPGATLCLATNKEDYFEEAKAYFTQSWGLALASERTLVQGEHVPRTHFEKKYLARGERCYELVVTGVGL
jgi:tRNA (guanine-N7-)-methyltransferase